MIATPSEGTAVAQKPIPPVPSERITPFTSSVLQAMPFQQTRSCHHRQTACLRCVQLAINIITRSLKTTSESQSRLDTASGHSDICCTAERYYQGHPTAEEVAAEPSAKLTVRPVASFQVVTVASQVLVSVTSPWMTPKKSRLAAGAVVKVI